MTGHLVFTAFAAGTAALMGAAASGLSPKLGVVREASPLTGPPAPPLVAIYPVQHGAVFTVIGQATLPPSQLNDAVIKEYQQQAAANLRTNANFACAGYGGVQKFEKKTLRCDRQTTVKVSPLRASVSVEREVIVCTVRVQCWNAQPDDSAPPLPEPPRRQRSR